MSAAQEELDVRPIPKPQRHPLIFAKLDSLSIGDSLTIRNDHNPIPLREQVAQFFAGQFEWRYLEEGPEIFRLCFTRVAAPPAGGLRSFERSLPVLTPTQNTAPGIEKPSS
jgi:uncharacterized protein (DUF2249 family)